jgi:hypothetical protein
MSFKDFTPEQRRENGKKGAETRRRNRAMKTDPLVANSALQPAPEAAEGFQPEDFPAPEIVYGEVAVEVESPESEAPPSAFGLFLLSLDRDTRELLSIDELRAIFTEQVAAATAEKKAAKKKAAAETAKQAARMEAGLIPLATREAAEWQRRMREKFRFKVELPPSGDQGETPDIGLRIDQMIFLDGYTHTLTRSQVETFRDIQYRVGQHELTFKGQNIRQRQWIMSRATGGVDRHIPLNADGSLA